MALSWSVPVTLLLVTTVHVAFFALVLLQMIGSAVLITRRNLQRATASRILTGVREARQLPVMRMVRH